MGRIVAFILGGLALALYGPHLFMSNAQLTDYQAWWTKMITDEWYAKIFTHGPGIFAGLALILVAVRGRDGGGGSYSP